MALQKGLVGHWNELETVSQTYDFEDGTLQGWQPIRNGFGIRTDVTRGSYSIGGEDNSAPLEIAKISPANLSGGRKMSFLEFYWYEIANSHGGGIAMMDSNGSEVLGVATDNDELNIKDDNGWEYVENGSGYSSWYRIEITFDWQNNTADVYWKDTDGSGVESTFTGRPLRTTTGIETLRIRNQNGESWLSDDDFNMWFDDISYELSGVQDNSAYDNHGDGIGGVSSGGYAPNGSAMTFDGTDDYIETGVSVQNAHSFSFWFQAGNLGDNDKNGILGSSSFENLVNYSAEFNVSKWWQDTTSSGLAASISSEDTWYHIAGVYDGSQRRYYKNGNQVDSDTVDRTTWQYGFIGNTAHGPFEGKLADVRVYNRALSQSEITQLYNQRSTRAHKMQRVPVAQQDLVAHYPFASSKVIDQTGNGYDGENNGATYVDDGGVNATGSYQFESGNGDYIPVRFFQDSTSIQQFSVSAWIKSTNTSAQIIYSDDRSEYFRFGSNSVGSGLTFSVDSSDHGTGDNSFLDGNWHHVAAVFDSTVTDDIKMYVDGKEVYRADAYGTDAGIGPGRVSYGFIGTGSEASSFDGSKGPSEYFDGSMSDVRLYNRALSKYEVKRLYESEKGAFGGIEKGYKSSDLSFFANQWNGSGNTGKVDITGSQFTKRNGEVVDITPIDNGVALQEDGSVSGVEGYIMYSKQSVFDRFSDNPPNGGNGTHLVGVRKNGETWEYDDNGSFHEFSPRPTDHLIAEVGWGVDFVNGLNIYS
jgi:hypothetical protein